MKSFSPALTLSLAMILALPAAAADPAPARPKPKPAQVKAPKSGKPIATAKKPKPSMARVPDFANDLKCQSPAQRVVTHRGDDVSAECRIVDKNGAYVINHGPWVAKRDADPHPHTRGYFKGSKKAGEWLYYFPKSGRVWIKGSWADDKGTGTWFVYDQDGDLHFKGNWDQFEQFRKQDTPRDGNWTFWMNK